MENVNLLNLHPNEWTAIGHRSYRSGPIEWDVHREFAERMFGKPRLEHLEKQDMFRTNKPAKPIQVVFSADKEAA